MKKITVAFFLILICFAYGFSVNYNNYAGTINLFFDNGNGSYSLDLYYDYNEYNGEPILVSGNEEVRITLYEYNGTSYIDINFNYNGYPFAATVAYENIGYRDNGDGTVYVEITANVSAAATTMSTATHIINKGSNFTIPDWLFEKMF